MAASHLSPCVHGDLWVVLILTLTRKEPPAHQLSVSARLSQRCNTKHKSHIHFRASSFEKAVGRLTLRAVKMWRYMQRFSTIGYICKTKRQRKDVDTWGKKNMTSGSRFKRLAGNGLEQQWQQQDVYATWVLQLAWTIHPVTCTSMTRFPLAGLAWLSHCSCQNQNDQLLSRWTHDDELRRSRH